MAQDRTPHQRHIAPKNPRHLSLKVTPVHAAEDVSKSNIIIKASAINMSHGFRYNNNWVMTNPDQKLSVSFWDYLGARLAIRKAPAIPPLPDLIRARSPPLEPGRICPFSDGPIAS